MTKGGLIESIRKSSNGLSKKAAGEVIRAVFSILSKTLKKEGRVAYPGFGVFTVRKRNARKGRNPKTGEAITIRASKTVGFKAGLLAEEKSLIVWKEEPLDPSSPSRRGIRSNTPGPCLIPAADLRPCCHPA